MSIQDEQLKTILSLAELPLIGMATQPTERGKAQAIALAMALAVRAAVENPEWARKVVALDDAFFPENKGLLNAGAVTDFVARLPLAKLNRLLGED